jgi:hypothetical protein
MWISVSSARARRVGSMKAAEMASPKADPRLRRLSVVIASFL